MQYFYGLALSVISGAIALPLAVAQSPTTAPAEIFDASYKPTSSGYEVRLLTPAPNKLKLVSKQNGDPLRVVLTGGAIAAKYPKLDGIHKPGTVADGIEVLKVRQLSDGNVLLCLQGIGGDRDLQLQKMLIRGDTLVFEVTYQKTAQPQRNATCQT